MASIIDNVALRLSDPRNPQKRLQTKEGPPRKQGDNTHQGQSYKWYRPVVSESLLGFGVSSVELLDLMRSSSIPPKSHRSDLARLRDAKDDRLGCLFGGTQHV